jgi:hypothetical protein
MQPETDYSVVLVVLVWFSTISSAQYAAMADRHCHYDVGFIAILRRRWRQYMSLLAAYVLITLQIIHLYSRHSL